MNCFICDKQPSVGGMRYHVKAAVGICHNCGVAVCGEHSHRVPEPGSPPLCPSGAEFLHPAAGQQAQAQTALHPAYVVNEAGITQGQTG